MAKETVTLETPIKRGDQVIKTVELRKPASGELRGIALIDLMRMDVSALTKVLPRISSPTLTEHDVGQMDTADLAQMGSTVSGFLLTKAQKAEFPGE